MTTIFTVFLLIVFAVVANFLMVLLLNLAGFPGALAAGKPGQRSRARFRAGSLIAALGQSLVYLGYVAFLVNWTNLAISIQGVSVVAWPIAFLAVMVPIYLNLIRARLEAREANFANPQVEALHITTLVALIAFFVFAFLPNTIEPVYGWVPYVQAGE